MTSFKIVSLKVIRPKLTFPLQRQFGGVFDARIAFLSFWRQFRPVFDAGGAGQLRDHQDLRHRAAEIVARALIWQLLSDERKGALVALALDVFYISKNHYICRALEIK